MKENGRIIWVMVIIGLSLLYSEYPAILTGKISEQGVFSLDVEIPESYEEIPVEENVWFTAKVLKFANTGVADVTLKYEILDAQRMPIASKSQVVAVETTASFVESMMVPKNAQKGIHFLKVTLLSKLGTSEAETSFYVVEEDEKSEKYTIIKLSLFDLRITIPENYKKINPGGQLLSSTELVNPGSGGRTDVFIEYWIDDSKQNIIMSSKETTAIETQAGFMRTFDIPTDAELGIYNLHTRVKYGNGKVAEAKDSFEIVKKQNDKGIMFVPHILLILIGIGIGMYGMHKGKPLWEKIRIRGRIAKILKKKQ